MRFPHNSEEERDADRKQRRAHEERLASVPKGAGVKLSPEVLGERACPAAERAAHEGVPEQYVPVYKM